MKKINVSTSKTRQELANEYGISRRTLYNWFKDAGLNFKGKILSPKDLSIVYSTFGMPSKGSH